MKLRRNLRERAVARGLGVATAATLGVVAATALAEEPRTVNEPHLLAEPAEITQVVDAFDEGDVFDAHLSIGYSFSRHSATILRETSESSARYSSGGYTRGSLKVADYSETTQRLTPRIEIGLYRDIAFLMRMPIILSNERELSRPSQPNPSATAGTPADGPTPLFALPFSSPSRSGVEYLALGLDFGLMNQYRDRTKPTWVTGFEVRLNLAEPMHACTDHPAPGQVKCAHPGDVNRNGRYDPELVDATGTVNLESSKAAAARKPGVSRGVTGLEFHTYLSKRIKLIEPYGGFRMLAEIPTPSSDYNLTDLETSLVNAPPLEGTLIAGLVVVPYEVRSAYQRVAIDLRFSSTYRSEGRDYSELFDALGSSSASSLRSPTWAEYREGPDGTSVVDLASQRVYVNGLTDVQQHIINRVTVEATWQAAKYMRFSLGTGFASVQSHTITHDQACNASLTSDATKSGPCRKDTTTTVEGYAVTGVPNPNYRSSINAIGRRFLVDDSFDFDGWINATVMF
jgi:hypothetical protein